MAGTEIDIDWIRQIANDVSGEIAADAEGDTQVFRDTTIADGSVGTLPVSQQYAAQVDAAHTFFAETIQSVIADLNDFAVNLKASADAHDENDGNAAAAINAIDTTYQDHSYQSAAENQESSGNEDLAVSEEASEAAAQAEDSGVETDGGPGAGAGPGAGSEPGGGAGGPNAMDVP